MVGGRPGDDATTPNALDRTDLRAAYEHGRRDERLRRRRHPLGMTLTFAFALVGVVMLALALVNGSFGRAGDVVDQSLSIATERAQPAAAIAGQALRNAAHGARSKVPNAAS